MHTLNGKTSRIQEGDYFIVDYGSMHSYQDSQDFMLINCLFLPEIVDDTLRGCQSFEKLMQGCLIRYDSPTTGQLQLIEFIMMGTDESANCSME